MRLLILTAFFAFTTFQPSRADPQIFELKNQFEHRISAYWSQKFPFGKGTFYAFEKAGDPASQARPEPHRMVAIDGFSGAKTSLTAPDVERSIRSFILESHIVSLSRSKSGNRVTVFRRADGVKIGSKQLTKGLVIDAQVEDDTLFLLHSYKRIVVSKFSLSDMKDLGEEDLGKNYRGSARGFRFAKKNLLRVSWRRPKYAELRTELKILTLSGELKKEIVVGNVIRNEAGTCGSSIDAIGERYAVLRRGCGQYSILDIEQAKIVFHLPRDRSNKFYDFALSGRFLFARPESGRLSAPTKSNRISVFELDTGRKLAMASLPGGKLLTSRGRLLLKTHTPRDLKVSVYSVDQTALLNADRSTNELQAAVQNARNTDDPYKSLEILESVSLDPMHQELKENGATQYGDVVEFYGRMLAYNPRSSLEGAGLLERLSEVRPADPSLKTLADAARLRGAIFSTDSETREFALNINWPRAGERPLLSSRTFIPNIHRRTLLPFVYFHEKRVFLVCNHCGEIKVFSRNTWDHITTLSVPGPVSSVVFNAGRMFISGPYSIQVYSLKTLECMKTWLADVRDARLSSGENSIGVCNCQTRRCLLFDAATLEQKDQRMPGNTICYGRDDQRKTITPAMVKSAEARGINLIYASQQYFVGNVGSYRERIIEFHRKDGESGPVRFPPTLSAAVGRQFYLTKDESHVVIADGADGYGKFFAVLCIRSSQ